MIFIDSNVFIFAVGRSHPLREEAQNVFLESSEKGTKLVTSAEVLQELLHVYLPVGRIETLDAALQLATKGVDHVIPITAGEVLFARNLADRYPGLSARDLLHLSVCRIHKVRGIKTFDRDLQVAFEGLR